MGLIIHIKCYPPRFPSYRDATPLPPHVGGFQALTQQAQRVSWDFLLCNIALLVLRSTAYTQLHTTC
jgi:hypothetical protein